MRRFRASWVVPVDAPPIANGAVLVDDRGRIADVGPDDAVASPDGIEQHEYDGAALIPGLINAHTHFELTGFAGMNAADNFWEWIQRIIALRATRTPDDFFNAACDGIRQSWAAGVTTICDMGSTGAVIAALDHLGASGIAHHEAFDLHTADTPTVMRGFTRDLDRLAHHATGRVSIGVSPHAPYTVSGSLYRAVGEAARAHGVPIGVHIAEPPDESALLRDFTGVFADFLKSRGVARLTAEPVSPIGWLDRHGILTSRTLCAHAIHTDVADTRLMARRGVAIAHCPRSNRRHHRADAPVRRYVEHGLRIGIGTDSEVSVAPIDLLAEAREAQQLAGWSSAETLRALTLGGAEALGLDATCGTLASGKYADFAVVDVGETDSVESAVVSSAGDQVRATWLSGRCVASRP